MIGLPDIVLVDDDPRELSKLSRLVHEYFSKEEGAVLPDHQLHVFQSPSAALDYVTTGKKADIVFLDIVMPGISGVEAASILREKGFSGYIVFLTSVNDFASESYMVGAFSYLLKPLERGRLFHILRLIGEDRSRTYTEDNAAIQIKTRQYSGNILFREIVFAEVMGRKVYIHLLNADPLSVNMPLHKFAPPLLADQRFAYCHSSIIVNMDHVETIKDNTAVLKAALINNVHSIPISRRHSDFKSRYISYSIGRLNGAAL